MNTTTTRRLLASLLAVALVAVLAGPVHATLTIYDDFASGDIDPELWSGFALEGSFAAPTAELIRLVESGALRLALVSWGDTAGDSGSVKTRQGLNMRQLGTPGGSGFITGLSAKLTVLDADAQDCTANPETTRPSRSRAQLIGGFFNDGSGGVGDRTGDILGIFQLQKERDGQNRIVAAVNRCVDATCSSSAAIPVPGTPAVFTGTWSLDTPVSLGFVWDRILGKFVFTVTNPATLDTESKEIVYAPTVTNAGPPRTDFKSLRVENDAENCAGGRKLATMDVRVDDVRVQRDGPDLALAKTHSGNVSRGQVGATYGITVRNVGVSPTTGVVTVTDVLPAGLTATALGGVGWSCTLGTLTCTRGDALATGASYPEVVVTVDVAIDAPLVITNTATVSGGGDVEPANNVATDPTAITPSDVAGHPFLTWIDALIEAGITSGCSIDPPQYCPEATVSRGQMAVFLLRGIHGTGYQPPAPTGMFTDVPVTGNPATTHPFAAWIEQLAREGITSGCGAGFYCPETTVTRGQMAVFLVRAFNLPI